MGPHWLAWVVSFNSSSFSVSLLTKFGTY
uniref:Uncharacterized protein n=1 Tax=Lepeophtheirus salmonis TaxID=72036 RepID=A0A0K2U2B6_LEPSM